MFMSEKVRIYIHTEYLKGDVIKYLQWPHRSCEHKIRAKCAECREQ